MAYMSQDRKRALVALAKPVLAKYGIKATFGTDRSSIKCNIKSGKLDFISNYNEAIEGRNDYPNYEKSSGYMQINPYHYDKHFTGECAAFFSELFEALNNDNHDNSDISTDYFDVGWYVHVNVGSWKKHYVVE